MLILLGSKGVERLINNEKKYKKGLIIKHNRLM